MRKHPRIHDKPLLNPKTPFSNKRKISDKEWFERWADGGWRLLIREHTCFQCARQQLGQIEATRAILLDYTTVVPLCETHYQETYGGKV